MPDVTVPIGPCACPRAHGSDDEVYLAPALSMAGGMAAQAAIEQVMEAGGDPILLQEYLARIWINHGIVGWNLVDEDGDPLPVNPRTIAERMPYGKGGRLVAERADDLYSEDILAPLKARLKPLSRRGSTASGPQPTSPTGASTRKRPSRSSTATTEQAPPSA